MKNRTKQVFGTIFDLMYQRLGQNVFSTAHLTLWLPTYDAVNAAAIAVETFAESNFSAKTS